MSEQKRAQGADSSFRNALKDGRFLLQTCEGCERRIFYPRQHCPSCGGALTKWQEASGRGVVYSTTTVTRSAEQGGAYNVSIIELEEGPRLMSCVVGATSTDISIGARVTARIARDVDEPLLVFELVKEAK